MAIRILKNQNGVPKGKVRFEFDTRIESVRYRKKIICQKSVVETFYNRWEKQILNGLLGKHKLFEKFDEYLDNIKTIKSERMYKHEKTILKDVFTKFLKYDIFLHDFKRSYIYDFINWRRNVVIAKYDNSQVKGKISNSTINRNLAVLSSFFNWCIIKEYYNGVNPCYRAKLKENNHREIRLSKDQIIELLECSKSNNNKIYNIILTALFTGMRRGEILTLTWPEIDFFNSSIILSKDKTKSNKARVIPIINTLKDLFLKIKNLNPNSIKVFDGVSRTIFQKEWNKIRDKLSFSILPNGTKIRFHDLRHVFAQSLLDQGIQLEDIQTLLGHQDIATTQKRYAMFARRDLHQKTEVLKNVIDLNKIRSS